jgi:hypothetical protein
MTKLQGCKFPLPSPLPPRTVKGPAVGGCRPQEVEDEHAPLLGFFSQGCVKSR